MTLNAHQSTGNKPRKPTTKADLDVSQQQATARGNLTIKTNTKTNTETNKQDQQRQEHTTRNAQQATHTNQRDRPLTPSNVTGAHLGCVDAGPVLLGLLGLLGLAGWRCGPWHPWPMAGLTRLPESAGIHKE